MRGRQPLTIYHCGGYKVLKQATTRLRMRSGIRGLITIRSGPILVAFLCVSVSMCGLYCYAAVPDSKIDGTVTAGSMDNRIVISITNPSTETSIKNAELEVKETGQWIDNLRIEHEAEGAIPPKSTRRFTVTFDVAADAETGVLDRVTLQLTAEGVLVDHPTPMIVVKIDRPQVVSENDEAGAPPVLKLLEIVGGNIPSDGYDYTAGQPGFAHGGEEYYREGDLRYSFVESVKFASLPSEIILGKAFEVAVEARKAVTFADCGTSAGGVRGKLNVGPLFAEFRSKGKFAAPGCGDDDPRQWARRGYTGPVGGHTAGLELRLIPQEVDEGEGDAVKYVYRTEASGNHGIEIRAPGSGILYTWNRDLRTTPRGLLASDTNVPPDGMLRITMDLGKAGRNLVALYGPVHSGDEALDTVPAYSHPPGSISASGDIPTNGGISPPVPHGESGVIQGAGIQERDTGSDAESDRDALTDIGAAEGGATGLPEMGESARRKPIDPNRLDPKNADVSRLIHEWIKTAKPPEDVVPANTVHYSGKGNIIGTVSGGSIESRHETGSIDPVFLWRNKRKLDSVNHCTLEEYVVAKLEEKSISHCAGRYGAVEDLKGFKLKEARAALTGAGFEYSLAPGLPAENPRDEGRIEQQAPGPGQYLKKGQTVKLIVYSPYVPGRLALPDFIGKSLSESKKWLKENNLEMHLKPGSPARTKEKSGAIEAQEPAPGTVMQTGGTVTLRVHSNYVDVRGVPEVVGLSAGKAKTHLANVGLKVGLCPGGKPPTREQAGTVKSQRPVAGSSIPLGSEVSIFIYGPYVNTAVVPDVRRLSYNDAKRRIESAGLSMSRRGAGQPHNRGLAHTATKQDPPSGSEVSRGKTVSVWFYGQYIPTREEQVARMDCSRFPGSRAYWDNNAGQPKCGCFDGLRWNIDNSACVPQKVFARQWCAKNRPGSVSVRKSDGGYECRCPNGYVWADNPRRCVQKTRPAEYDRGTGDTCPCVDENGRRYRPPLGQDCGADLGAWGRDYNCPDDSREDGRRKPRRDTGAESGNRRGGNTTASAECLISVSGNIHNYKYFYVTTKGRNNSTGVITYRVTNTGVPFTPDSWGPGTQQIGGTYRSESEALRKARQLCPNGKIYR